MPYICEMRLSFVEYAIPGIYKKFAKHHYANNQNIDANYHFGRVDILLVVLNVFQCLCAVVDLFKIPTTS